MHKLGKIGHFPFYILYCSSFLGMFYYTLGNIRPELRSTHRSVQLIACVTSKNLEKYGFAPVLRPFITDVNDLCRVFHDMLLNVDHKYLLPISFSQNGMTVQVDDRTQSVCGSVIVTLADTLAAHQLGGFKVGVGFALVFSASCVV